MKKRVLFGLLSVIMTLSMVLSLASCGKKSTTSTSGKSDSDSTTSEAKTPTTDTPKKLDKVTIQLKWLPQAQFMGYYIADKKGFFKDEGIDIDILPGGSDIIPEQVVSSGKADVGVTWVSSLLKYQAQGYELKEIAQIFQKSALLLVAKASSGIKTPADLAGKKVGNWYGGNEYEILALLEKYKLKNTLVQQDYTMDQLVSGSIDAASAMTYNEYGLLLESGIPESDLVKFDMNDEGVAMMEDCLFVDNNWAKQNKDVLVRFLKAAIKGWAYASANPEEAGKIVSEIGQSVSEAHQVYMAKEVAKLVVPAGFDAAEIGKLDDKSLGLTLDLAKKYASSSEVDLKPLKLADVYTDTYWKAATGK